MSVWALTHTPRRTHSQPGEGKQRAARPEEQGGQDALLPAAPAPAAQRPLALFQPGAPGAWLGDLEGKGGGRGLYFSPGSLTHRGMAGRPGGEKGRPGL